jgi:hypothetical protein
VKAHGAGSEPTSDVVRGRSLRRVLPAVLASSCALAVGCSGGECDKGPGRASLAVTVQDASGTVLCDATVTARAGTFSSALSQSGPPQFSACVYYSNFELPGTFDIEVRRGSTVKRLNGVVVKALPCGVETRAVTIVVG